MYEIVVYIVLASVLAAFVSLVMGARITENMQLFRFNATEPSSNTFAEVDIPIPLAVLGEVVQALEIMKVHSQLSDPSPEAGQDNAQEGQITRRQETAMINFDDDSLLYRVSTSLHGETGAAGEMSVSIIQDRVADLTDGDGNGLLMPERTIHAGVRGSGNAAAGFFRGWIGGHIKRLSGLEAAALALVES